MLLSLNPVPGILAAAEQVKFTESLSTVSMTVRFLVTSYRPVMVFVDIISLPSMILSIRGPPTTTALTSVGVRVSPSYKKEMEGDGMPEAVQVKVMSVTSLVVNC